jgi:hypothetical protein
MLNDEDAINDVNPFVTRDFSLPGGVRQMNEFENFSEMVDHQMSKPVTVDERSVFCDFGLCRDQIKPTVSDVVIKPKRNIDTGFTCPPKRKAVKEVRRRVPFFGIFLCLLLIVLIVLYSGRR